MVCKPPVVGCVDLVPPTDGSFRLVGETADGNVLKPSEAAVAMVLAVPYVSGCRVADSAESTFGVISKRLLMLPLGLL